MGKRGQWSRWGRGMCEDWSLEIGNAVRGAVVRRDRIDQPATWLASVNAAYLGEYLDRDAAMARVQAEIELRMELTLHDWEVYLAGKAQRRQRKSVGRRGEKIGWLFRVCLTNCFDASLRSI
jgi:hypothetical protein